MVGDVKLWYISGLIWYKFSSVILGSFSPKKYSSSSISVYSVRCSWVALTRMVDLFLGSLELIKSYGSLKRATFTLRWWCWNVVLVRPETYVSVQLLNYFDLEPCLWLIWRSCSPVSFLFFNKGLQKGQVFIVPSYSIIISFTY